MAPPRFFGRASQLTQLHVQRARTDGHRCCYVPGTWGAGLLGARRAAVAMPRAAALLLLLLALSSGLGPAINPRGCSAEFVLLDPHEYEKHFVEGFPGPWANGSGVGVINETTFEWARENVPFFASSDADLTEAYYFRW
eukprot:COSAG01_NODE_33467_length_563_cov_1.896552_1_plen_138_part_10